MFFRYIRGNDTMFNLYTISCLQHITEEKQRFSFDTCSSCIKGCQNRFQNTLTLCLMCTFACFMSTADISF